MIDVEKIKKYEPLYVIGHRNPDVDTIVSSYLLSKVLNYLGVKSYICFLDKEYNVDTYNSRIINDYLEFMPVVINSKEVDKYNFVLVDHNDPNQSIGEGANIVFGMDHHKDSGKVNNILFGNTCSNGLFIYNYFKDIYPFSYKEKELIVLTAMTDTLFFKTDRYTKYNEDIIKNLGVELDNNLLLKKYFIPTDLSIGINKYLEKSDRDFSYHGINFTSSVIHSFETKKEIIDEYKEKIKNINDNHLGMWRDLTNNKTYAFLKVGHLFKEFKYDCIAGRANTVMVDVINLLKELDKK